MAEMNGHIALIGAPGSGKSTLARQYKSRHPFKTVIDTDDVFVSRHGDITTFFEREGEQAFRSIEHSIVEDAVGSDADIIVCGGGAVLDKRNVNLLRRHCGVVRLTAPRQVIIDRIINTARPIVKYLPKLLDDREPLYSRYADHTLDTSKPSLCDRLETLISDGVRGNRYDVLLCDADETLLDFKKAMRTAVVNAARAVGINSCDDKIVSHYSEITTLVWRMLENKQITRAELDGMRFVMLRERLNEYFDPTEMNAVYVNEMRNTRFVLDGAVGFLDCMRKRGIKVYVVTNSFTRIAEERLKALAGHIDGAFISEDIGFDKPDPRFFERVCQRIGYADKDRMLVIGDSVTSDIAGGKAFGIDTCLFDRDKTKECTADYIVSSYGELSEIV